MKIPLATHPIYLRLKQSIRSLKTARFPTNEDLIFHTIVQLHEKQCGDVMLQ